MKLYLTRNSILTTDQVLLLNNLASDVRIDYNNIIGELIKSNEKNIDWWVSEIASRNTETNHLFIGLCYISLIDALLKQKIDIEEIVVDLKSLAKILSVFFIKNHLPVKISLQKNFLTLFKEYLRPFYSYFKNCIHFFRQFYLAKIFKKNHSRKGLEGITLVDVFLFDHSFKDNEYLDRYYNGFNNFLTEEEKKYFYYIPTFIDITNYRKLLRNIRNSKQKFLLKEDFLSLKDYFFALGYPFRMLHLKPKPVKYKNFEIYPLLYEVWLKNLTLSGSMDALLKFRFAKRLRENGVRIRLIIDWFENQMIDKGAALGFKKYFPETTIVGHQISSDHKYYLCYYPTEDELKNDVLPHEISVTGKGFIPLVKEFCPDLNVSVSPSFRYSGVWRRREFFPDKNFFTVLLALPYHLKDRNDILRLVSSICEKNLPGNTRFWIKHHPGNTIEQIKKFFDAPWPEKFNFINGDFNKLVEKSNILIGNNSSSSIETVAKGIPVIIVGSRTGLTQNPIPSAIEGDIWRLCYTEDELLKTIEYYANCDDKKVKEFDEMGRKIREEYFEFVSKEATRKFLRMD